MALIADFLIVAASFAAMFYCRALAGRLRRLKDLDQGVGAAIATLSAQVEELRGAMAATRKLSGNAADSLLEMTARAEIAAGRLEILLANVHENTARPAAAQTTGTKPAATAGATEVPVPVAARPAFTARFRMPSRNEPLVEGLPQASGAEPAPDPGRDIVRALKQALAGGPAAGEA